MTELPSYIVLPELPQFNTLCSQLERCKRQFQPEIPHRVDEVDLWGVWAEI